MRPRLLSRPHTRALIGALLLLTIGIAHGQVFPSVTGLPTGRQGEIDRIVNGYLRNYDYLNIALVLDGETVYVASYGEDRTGEREVYASVSKPVTATVVMMLLQTGMITSLDD